MTHPASRIVCLTEETVETLYLLGEEARIVGVSGYAVRPARVRREKPRVAAFTSADVPKILALAPDLVLAFSDLQADIVAELIRAGLEVHVFNQRDIAGPLSDLVDQIVETVIRTLAATAPELAADIHDQGIVMTGGGSLLSGIGDALSLATGVPVTVADNAMTSVAMGAGLALEDPDYAGAMSGD